MVRLTCARYLLVALAALGLLIAGCGSGGGPGEGTAGLDGGVRIAAISNGIHIEKSTNGQDADSPPGPILTPGDPVTWEYYVMNPGTALVSNIVLMDSQLGSIPCPKTVLDIGESMTCVANGTVMEGQYMNIGNVTGVANAVGNTPEPEPVSAIDPSHYFGITLSNAIDIEKATNGEDADSPPGPTLVEGDPVTWTYKVTNRSNALISNITVMDSQIGNIPCPQDELEPAEMMTCVANGTVMEGQYENIGMVNGLALTNTLTSDTDPSHYFGESRMETVSFDIKPGSCPNPINGKSKGVLPVAVLGTDEFDVTVINTASLRLGTGMSNDVAYPIRHSYEDVGAPFIGNVVNCLSCGEDGPDGYLDLTLKFRTQEVFSIIGNTSGDITLVIHGALTDGTEFEGEDIVITVPKKK
jgi:hypothetical protein